MLSTIFDFLMLRRAVAAHPPALTQPVSPATHTTQVAAENSQSTDSDEEWGILQEDHVFRDAMWEHAGSVKTDWS
jgi:hypothetical protein